MVFVVNEDGNVEFEVDAWLADCMEKVAQYVADHGLHVVAQDITMNGDMVVNVVR